jgi:hypothetical protein
MMKIEGSGSISQRHGSADPDPHQNIMDPQHWFLHIIHVPGTESCTVVDCHRFEEGSGAFHLNVDPDPDPDPTLFYTCWNFIFIHR